MTLAYDGANNLQTRTAGGVTTRYFYHHAIGLVPILAERNETAGRMQRYYVWTPGGRLLYAIDPANGNAVSHYHFDQVGSTLALTAANGSVTDAYAYTPLRRAAGPHRHEHSTLRLRGPIRCAGGADGESQPYAGAVL